MKTTQQKTLIEQYISTKSFKNHVAKCTNKYDINKRFIDDCIQDFCEYYLNRPDKRPNIRKLYNLCIDKIKAHYKYICIDINELYYEINEFIDDDDFFDDDI